MVAPVSGVARGQGGAAISEGAGTREASRRGQGRGGVDEWEDDVLGRVSGRGRCKGADGAGQFRLKTSDSNSSELN